MDEFVSLARERDIRALVTEHILNGDVFVFRRDQRVYEQFKERLGNALGVAGDEIRLVGSAKLGYSLAPHKFGEAFTERSDLDVVVVDATMFDRAWLELVRLGRGTRGISESRAEYVKEHRRNNVFWGFIEPEKLVGIVSCYRFWFPAFQGISAIRDVAGRDVKGRLYRTWEHATLYHIYGVQEVLAARR